ncbi:N-acetylmuramoyl-L-alanine amidase [Nocardia sp. NPDC127579]|uniref:N-acetylmuramoyl-L-alanine amidase n=1 Tax=Nocardia sp. NPDC127579 TaxID=3345402 RepID=UPI00363E7F70
MKPRTLKTGLCTGVTAAIVATLSGLLPTAAHAAPVPPELAAKLLGKTIFLDPGHQGANHGENLERPVDNGRGGTKPCQTTGMVTANGVPEHTITWNVAQLVKSSLENLGAQVVLSRADDSGWGGCVDDRARAAGASGAAVAVSIHADSAPQAGSGFHLIVPQLPIPDPAANQAQSTAGLAASTVVRDAYLQAGFHPAQYAGVQDGLQTRADIAGPALSAVPTVFVEMGNGADPEDAAVLESEAGQLRHAMAITTGLASHLLGVAPGGTGSADNATAGVPLSQPMRVPNVVRNAPRPTTPEAETTPTPQYRAAPSSPTPGNQYQAAPGTPTPGSQYQAAPGSQTPTTPGNQYQAAPSTPGSQYQAAPGCPTTADTAQVPGCSVPGTQSDPKTKSDTDKPDTSTLVTAGMQLLMPLIRSFGMDNSAITSELINLAYTLASTLLGPAD